MTTRGEAAEATVVSQLLIIGITAGIVFVAATYAFFAVDTAIEEADSAASQLSLRGAMHRVEALAGQGVGASSVIQLPSQGEINFAGYAPPAVDQDRIIIEASSNAASIVLEELDDGDAQFSIDVDRNVVAIFTWFWTEDGITSDAMGIGTSGRYHSPGDRAIGGATSIVIYDADDDEADRVPLLTVLVVDLHVIQVGNDSGALVGNVVVAAGGHAAAQTHVQGGDALLLRVWGLAGPSFAAAGSDVRLHVQVLHQAWMAQLDGIERVTITPSGEHASALLGLYQEQGAHIQAGSALWSVDRLDVHATAMHAELHR